MDIVASQAVEGHLVDCKYAEQGNVLQAKWPHGQLVDSFISVSHNNL